MILAALRVVAGVAAVPLAGLALTIFAVRIGSFDPISASLGVLAASFAALCAWFAVRGHLVESRARIAIAVIGGVVVGGVAFAAGFFGPIVFAPDANQGPLLGIFITGPLGFAAGVALGWLYGRIRRAKGASSAATPPALRRP